ncbi:torsin-1A-interacting protein 2-like [Balaenoptera musculus]|uniref:Torsin-1A-interacting protein 2-like n=1 Tax=Balaenoptera musculus TaxID=9771 RepID=A0A8B8WXR1_BALMU|nr:torsin-1A-interacting protein 2-like [Balaenoptera musculus]
MAYGGKYLQHPQAAYDVEDGVQLGVVEQEEHSKGFPDIDSRRFKTPLEFVPVFSDNSHGPDCGQQWFPSLELGHWLYQTELVENECCQVFLERINRADYRPECYPDNPANRSLFLPWSFPLEGAPQNLTRWTFEKACHPFLLGPPLVRKRIYDSRVAGFNPALQLILIRTDKTLNKKLGQSK